MVELPKSQDGEVREGTLQKKVRANRLKWSVPFLAAFMPIVLLSVYSFQVSSSSVRTRIEEENISASGNFA